MAIVFQDEASFFEINQANDVIDVSHRYIAKSDPYLIVVSTPNKPGDMLHMISEQQEEKCIYRRVYLPYTSSASFLLFNPLNDNFMSHHRLILNSFYYQTGNLSFCSVCLVSVFSHLSFFFFFNIWSFF